MPAEKERVQRELKKRNQIVRALLMGVVLGSTTAGVALSAPAMVYASEEVPSDGQDEIDSGAQGSDGESGSAGDDTSDSGESGNTDNSGSGTSDGSGTDGGSSSDTGSSDISDGGSSTSSGTDSSGTSDSESGTTSDPESNTSSDADSSAEEDAAAAAEKAAAEIAAEAAEAADSVSAELSSDMKADANEADDIAERSRKAAEDEEAGLPASSYGIAASNRDYYSGSYFVTDAQKRLALNIGFEQVDKVYAMSGTGSTINIREGKGEDQRIVGTISEDGIMYILEDDGGDWLFVESGEVRGYVKRDVIKYGTEVDELVEKTGEDNMPLADQLIDPLENEAYRSSLKTTKELNSLLNKLGEATVDRQAMVSFSMQFLGNPYVWGGDSLTQGCDCSGFTQQIYAEFGMSLPRCSYEQAEVGVKIPAEEALPGDLLFYARDGVVYHVLMYIGDGKAINASSTTTGIIISNVNYDKVCWACRFIEETTDEDGKTVKTTKEALSSGTQASDLQAVGQMAYAGDETAQQEIISALAKASLSEYSKYGFARSVIIAQAINETGWLSFPGNGAGILSTDNNVLGMNADLNNDTWRSPWTGRSATRLVPQYRNGGIDYDFEDMRLYEDIESCLEDYAAFKVGTYAQLRGETDVDKVIGIGLAHYASDPSYQENIKKLIEKYDLTQYDVVSEDEEETDTAAEETADSVELTENNATDATEYTSDELDLIYAIVAETDDTSYEGALAVISTAMNRADADYGEYGETALAQLMADGQYVYSEDVDSTQHYKNRLDGNVPDFVKTAVDDCLTGGIRDTAFNTVSTTEVEGAAQIGSCWYYSTEAEE